MSPTSRPAGQLFRVRGQVPRSWRLPLAFAAFALPLALWCAVSYVPWIWHPLVEIDDPGDTAAPGAYGYLAAGQQVDREVFARRQAELAAVGARPASGRPANPIYLPAPHAVAAALYTAFNTPPQRPGDHWLHESLWHSCRIIFWGFIYSALLGVPLGIACGAFGLVSRVIEPFVDFVRYMPAPVFGALAVTILGLADGPKIAIVFIGTFFQLVLVVANTTRDVDPHLLEAGQTLGASRSQLIRHVLIPAMLPRLFGDLRILLGWAWTYLVVAELIGEKSGISAFLYQEQRYRNFDNVYAAILIIGVIGLVSDQLLARVGIAAFPWRYGGSRRPSSFRRFRTGFARRRPAPSALPPDRAPLHERSGVLAIDDLTRTFPGGAAGEVIALDRVSFEIRQGEFVSVIGPSGCGKSTLARIVAGLAEPTSGQVRVGGRLVRGPGAERGMVFQQYSLFPWLTVLDNVAFGPRRAGSTRAEARRTAEEWLERVGLSRWANAYPAELSGGMQQRVAIARALANGPRVLLMDEPFGALDAQTRASMQTHLLAVWAQVGITIAFITHDLDEAIYLSDRIVVLGGHPGRVLEVVSVPAARPRGREALITDHALVAVRARLAALIGHSANLPTHREES